ncbi:MAG: AAA family ATPase [Flavobacteriales bacterium]|jgi:predicted ATP-dependent endonuclease of OLD family|nr:AAA family ATPase [Flavobacteriales bacterium]
MKITKFKIENYRAIENIEFTLNFSINPIIGINEAGKTSVLKAILAFDKSRDRYNGGKHLEYENNYTIKQRDCRILAFIKLEKKEKEDLIERIKINTESEDFKIINSLNNDFLFILERSLSKDKKPYQCTIEGITEKTLIKISKYLVSKLPYILYFDDFADRVPSLIQFPDDYRESGKIGRVKNREWNEIIEEIFKRADTEGIDEDETETPLISYLKIEDRDKKSDIRSDVEDTLNEEIIKEWKRIKKSGESFADDSDKLELVIVNTDNTFEFKVKDKSHKGKKRTFDISERSKGFQWFFNYMVKLKFNPNYKGKLENSIFLLDEPGSYLHSSAQSELLKELESVSKKNTIIYCTHSQYLLNPEIIKLGSIRIAEKKDSKINLQNFGSYKSRKDKGALSPIYQALNLNFAHDFVGKIIITEGITDFYFFNILQKHTSFIENKLKFIPSSGASQSTTLISFAYSFADNFIIFLDNDKAGRSAKKKYLKEFGNELENKIHIYGNKSDKFELEDFLCEKDAKNLLILTESNDLKRALGFLFYDYAEKQVEFCEKLSDNTKENLKHLFETLEKI